MKQRDYIDGLRAIAIIPVVVFHAWPSALPGGFVGVSVFFVISGFLITYLIAEQVHNGAFSFRAFYARRVRRLLPAAACVFVAVFAASVLILAPDALRGFGRSLVAADLLHANVYFSRTAGYFDAPSHEKPLLHFWSLSIEEQFYLGWPVVIAILLPRLHRRVGLLLLAGFWVLSLGFAESMARTSPDQAFYSLLARAWELMTGALLALVIDRLRLRPRVDLGLGLVGVLGILSSLFWLDGSVTFPGLSAVPACLGTAAVLACGFHRANVVSRILAVRPMVTVGLISYSLYLWHWPLLSLVRYYLERPLGPVGAAIIVAVACGLSALSWRFVEQPFRSAEGVFRREDVPTLKAGALVMALVAMLGWLAQADRGWVWRYGPEASLIFEQRLKMNPWEARCDNIENIFRDNEHCNFGRPMSASETFEVVVLGDSNADHFVPLIAELARLHDLSGRQVTQTACGGVLGVGLRGRTPAKRDECLAYQRLIVEFVERNPSLRLAIISGNWRNYQGRLEDSGLVLPGQSASLPAERDMAPDTLEYHLRRTIEFLGSRGISVHLVSQIPYQDGLPIRCAVNALRLAEGASQCGVSASEARADIAATDALFRRLASEVGGVSATIPTDFMCNADVCPIIMDGMLLYRDEAHLNADGARHLQRYFELPALTVR